MAVQMLSEYAGNSTIQYDALGNIKTYSSKGHDLTYTYNYTANSSWGDTATNRLRQVHDSEGQKDYLFFTYDDRGNITNTSFNNLTFNRANQLSAANGSNSYVYDGHGRRIKQTDSEGTSYSMYSLDGTLMYRENPYGGINYIYLGKKLIAKDGFIPENSGKQHYRPYGDSIEGATDDVGYTGHKFDKDLGLSYMQARYYDPVIGRFYSNDAVGTLGHLGQGNLQGFNRYAYANNNPYKYTDPDGRAPVVLAWFATPPGQAALVTAGKWVAGITGTAIGVGIANDVVKPMMNESGETVFEQDGVGKIKNRELNADNIADEDLEDAIDELDGSIGQRENENSRYPKGNPNGNSRDRENHKEHKKHKERIKREKDLRDKLKDRLENGSSRTSFFDFMY